MYIPSVLNEVDQMLIDLQSKFLSLHSHATPRVVFDCDQTLIEGDIGEYTLAYVLHYKLTQADSQWWSYLSAVLDDDSLQVAYQSECMDSTCLSNPLLQKIWQAYRRLCKVDVHNAYLWAAHCFHHLHTQDAQDLIQKIYLQAKKDFLSHFDQASYIHYASGIRIRASQRELIKRLQNRGVEVWIISSSHQFLIQCVARDLNIPSTQAIGIMSIIGENQRLSLNAVQPAPIGHGKKDYYLHYIDQIFPMAMFGDSSHDLPLMKAGLKGFFIEQTHISDTLKQQVHAIGAHVINSQNFL
jgi:phosphoserine phosphatase